MAPSISFSESFYFFLGDSSVKNLEVSFFQFYLFLASFTFWDFNPFFPQGKVQPLNICLTDFPNQFNGMDEWEK